MAIDTGLRDERALAVCERNGDLARAEFRRVERELDDLLADVVGKAVSDTSRPRPMIVEGI